MSTTAVKTAAETVASQTFTVTTDKKGKRHSEASPEVRALVKRALACAARKKKAEEEEKQIKADLADLMAGQGIDTFTWEGSNIATRTETTPARFDNAAFDAAHPGMRDRFKVRASVPEVRMTLR